MKRFGSYSLAYATLQSDSNGKQLLEYFDTHDGFIAFAATNLLGSRKIALGEPICSAKNVKALLRAFILTYPKTVFVQVGETVAHHLEDLGFSVNRFGIETFLDLDSYTLSGRSHEDIRTMLNCATKHGVVISEQPSSEVSIRDVQRVDREWMESRVVKRRELGFMVRPAIHTEEPFVRKLYAYHDGVTFPHFMVQS